MEEPPAPQEADSLGERSQPALDALERGAARRRAPFRRSGGSDRFPRGVSQTEQVANPNPPVPFSPDPPSTSPRLATSIPDLSSPRASLEDELAELRHRLAILQAEQARDHAALRLLAAGWSNLSRESAQWPNQAVDFRSRLESLEARLEQTTLVLPGQRIDPLLHAGSPEEALQKPAGAYAAILSELEKLRSAVMGALGLISREIAAKGLPTPELIVTGVAVALLAMTFRLFAG